MKKILVLSFLFMSSVAIAIDNKSIDNKTKDNTSIDISSMDNRTYSDYTDNGTLSKYKAQIGRELEKGVKNIDIAKSKEILEKPMKVDKNLTGLDNKTQEMVRQIYNKYNNTTVQNVKEIRDRLDFDPNTGIISLNSNPVIKKDNTTQDGSKIYGEDNKNLLAADERIYVFISSGLPKEIITNYKDFLRRTKLGEEINFVVRGCVPTGGVAGCKNFRETMKFAASLVVDDVKNLDNTTSKKGLGGVLIDPKLFKAYQVDQVPQVVYAKGVERRVDLGSEGDFKRLKSEPTWWKSEGDWSLDYHIYKLGQASGNQRLIDRFQIR